jgi:proline dehydrogenase
MLPALALRLPAGLLRALPAWAVARAAAARFAGGRSKEEALRVAEARVLAPSARRVLVALDGGAEDVEAPARWAANAQRKAELIQFAGAQRVCPFVAVKASSLGKPWGAAPGGVPEGDGDGDGDGDGGFAKRLDALAAEAAAARIALLVDAEQSARQGALSAAVVLAARRRGDGTLFNTYQAYLACFEERLAADLAAAERDRFQLGVKLVRGAYMSTEPPGVLQSDKQATDVAFDHAVEVVLAAIARGAPLRLVVATHNEASCRRAADAARRLGIRANDQRLWFGQILGLGEQCTSFLAERGFNVFKLLVFGADHDLAPWLVRRVDEMRFQQLINAR